jgi:hypothetical protein
MVYQNVRIEQQLTPTYDWLVFGEIYTDDGVFVADFGPNGTSVFQWFPQQSSEFQYHIVMQFIPYMAAELAKGASN